MQCNANYPTVAIYRTCPEAAGSQGMDRTFPFPSCKSVSLVIGTQFLRVTKLPCTVHPLLKDKSAFVWVMSNVELVDKGYNTLIADLAAQYRKIEPFLLIKSAMLRRKYPSENKQHFWLELYYKEGVDTNEKSAHIFEQVGRLPSYHGHYHFVLDIQAKLDTLLSIASDKDIERIAGDVYPISA